MDNYLIIIIGILTLGWLQFASLGLVFTACKAKDKGWAIIGFILWVFVAVVVSVVVIDQFIVLPWLELTNFHICGK